MMRIFTLLSMAVLISFTSCGGGVDTEQFVIASEQANCMGVAPQKCLLMKKSMTDDWEFWYSGIEGFEYERGYEYVIKVRKKEIANPPADRASFVYVLEKIVSKERKESANLPPAVKPSELDL